MRSSGYFNDIPCNYTVTFLCESRRPIDEESKAEIECDIYENEYLKSDLPEVKFYKMHLEHKNWDDAVKVCQSEGAKLAVINSVAESNLYKSLLDKNPSAFLALVGFNDKENHDQYVTIDGTPLEDSGFYTWGPTQPDNWGGNEHCGSIHRNGFLNDVACDVDGAFICEKTKSWCDVTSKGHKKREPSGYWYYKLHTTPKTWSEASFVCQSENGQLAVINSEEEAQVYVKELEKYPSSSLSGDFNKESIALGFHDRFSVGKFVTWDGTPLGETGYEKWATDKPTGNEHCGSMLRSGYLNDIPCNLPVMFFCESRHPFDEKPKPEIECDTYEHEYLKSDLPELKFYKLHLEPKNWDDAVKVCQSEGAKLAVINSDAESQFYRSLIYKYSSINIVLVGFNDKEKEGEYMTIDGTPLKDCGFYTWAPTQPDNWGGNEHCGSIQRSGLLNDIGCDKSEVFICEKTKSRCDVTTKGYKLNPTSDKEKYYKFHLDPKIWEEALLVCQTEHATLAVITSDEEAKLYDEEFQKHPASSISEYIPKNLVSLGFHDRLEKTKFVTIKGVPLKDAGYNKWTSGRPNNAGDPAHCGSMERTGLLEDISCWYPYMFICEASP